MKYIYYLKRWIIILIIVYLRMLESESPTVQSPQERIEAPTDDENTETVQLDRDSLQNRKIEKEVKKKRVSKGKKK